MLMTIRTQTVIFDLDGTLSDPTHRDHIRAAGDWDGYFAACLDDAPLASTILMLRTFLQLGYRVIIATGRSDAVRSQTLQWLERHVCGDILTQPELIMRPARSRMSDHALKLRWLNDGLLGDADRIVCVFEDRASVVRMWRNAGLTCYQVADGDF